MTTVPHAQMNNGETAMAVCSWTAQTSVSELANRMLRLSMLWGAREGAGRFQRARNSNIGIATCAGGPY